MNPVLLLLTGFGLITMPLVAVWKKYRDISAKAFEHWIFSMSLEQLYAWEFVAGFGGVLMMFGWYELLAVWK